MGLIMTLISRVWWTRYWTWWVIRWESGLDVKPMLTVGGWDCGVDFGMDAVAHAQMGDLGELLSENFW